MERIPSGAEKISSDKRRHERYQLQLHPGDDPRLVGGCSSRPAPLDAIAGDARTIRISNEVY